MPRTTHWIFNWWASLMAMFYFLSYVLYCIVRWKHKKKLFFLIVFSSFDLIGQLLSERKTTLILLLYSVLIKVNVWKYFCWTMRCRCTRFENPGRESFSVVVFEEILGRGFDVKNSTYFRVLLNFNKQVFVNFPGGFWFITPTPTLHPCVDV